MLITPAYVALFAVLFVVLSFRTIRFRQKFLIGVGHGNNPALERASRVHANFAEYVPLSLLLLYFLEIQGANAVWIHVLCIGLLIGRILHAFGVSQVKENLRYRKSGMVLTFAVIISTSIGILVGYI